MRLFRRRERSDARTRRKIIKMLLKNPGIVQLCDIDSIGDAPKLLLLSYVIESYIKNGLYITKAGDNSTV